MKISKPTKTLLKNFASINSGIILEPGGVIRTKATDATIYAKGEIAEDIPLRVPLYDLNAFLAVLGSFTDPDVEFEDTHLVVREGRARAKFLYADEEAIVAPAAGKDITLPSPEVEFSFEEKVLAKTLKFSDVLSAPNFIIRRDADKVVAEVIDTKNPSSNSFAEEVAEYDGDTDFSFVFRREVMKMLPSAYDVSLSSKNISRFVGEIEEGKAVTYFIAMESTSKYG